MNMATQTTHGDSPKKREPAAETVTKPATEDVTRPAIESTTKPVTILGATDVDLLREGLGTGLSGYARKGDVIELHKRISERFDGLPSVLSKIGGEQDGDDNAVEKLHAVETALNGLEGALRIELAPFLTTAVREEISRSMQPRRPVQTAILACLILISGIAVGTIWSGEIATQIQNLRVATGL